jgi:ubiquinone/menaquinone biosynthesis C-methylase UbiE
MAQQHQHDRHDDGQAQDNEAGLADLLDLDAEALASCLDEMIEWVGQHAPNAPRRVVDIGAGTGTGSRALARRFGAAEVVAIDTSPVMLERLSAADG